MERSLLSTRALLIGVEIVTTPLRSRQEHRSVIRVERVSSDKLNSDRIHYIAGGSYCGIVVNKAVNGTPPFLLGITSFRLLICFVISLFFSFVLQIKPWMDRESRFYEFEKK